MKFGLIFLLLIRFTRYSPYANCPGHKIRIRRGPPPCISSIHNSYLPICSTIDWYCRFSKDVGHYTAMVWSNTNKIGCGITEFREGKWFAKLYTCNYGPAGNYIGGQMYAKGRACTKCPSGTSCSVQYPGLCGK